jgi:hypothetical protein
MCCVFATLLALGPRLAILVWWLIDAARFHASFGTWGGESGLVASLPGWLLPLLACLILPWTSLAYLLVYRGGVTGSDWLWLAVGVLLDLSTHGGGIGAKRRRDRK